jgi:2-keto-4-pentenoate hydratase
MDRIADAASMLAAARLSGLPLEQLPVLMRPRDEAEAYWVQNAVHALISRSRYGALAGYKVACSTPAAQRYLGIKKPCSGGLFSGTLFSNGVEVPYDAFQRMGIECEIAVRLSADLLPADGPFNAAAVAKAVESYMPAIQIVDDRYVDWRRTDTATLIADDFFSAAAVIGEAVPAGEVGDPVALTGRATVNGTEIGFAHASDLMGHPMNVLAWLANAMAGRGEQLRAGEIVLLGGLLQTRWLNAGDKVSFDVTRMGRVEFSVV